MKNKLIQNECTLEEYSDWRKEFISQSALHNPDMVAGGFYNDVTDFGHSGANSSIGIQWVNRRKSEKLNRIQSIETSMFGTTLPLPDDIQVPKDTLMNVKLESVCTKKPGCGKT